MCTEDFRAHSQRCIDDDDAFAMVCKMKQQKENKKTSNNSTNNINIRASGSVSTAINSSSSIFVDSEQNMNQIWHEYNWN